MLHFNGPAEEAAVENGQGIGWAGRRRPFEDCVLVLPPSPLTTWLHFSQHKIYIYVRLQSEKHNKKQADTQCHRAAHSLTYSFVARLENYIKLISPPAQWTIGPTMKRHWSATKLIFQRQLQLIINAPVGFSAPTTYTLSSSSQKP